MGLLCACLPLGQAHAQQTASFQDGVTHGGTYDGTRDVIIKDGVGDDANFGNANFLRVTTNDIGQGLPTWTLLRWDIAGDIPPGCVVLSATITLEVDPADPGATTQAYQLTRDWVEGNGVNNSGATWTTFDGTTAWGADGANDTNPPGQDRFATVVANIPGGSGTQVVNLNAAGVAMVQQWVDDPTTNFGINIRSGSANGVNYASREDPTPGNRPRLDVTFALPSLGGGGGTATFQQGVSGYTGTEDSYPRESSPGTQYGNATFMYSRHQNGQRRRPILRFRNLSPTIPPGATITGASLQLYSYNAGNGDAQLYEVLRPWVETQLNWNQFSTGNAWGTPGCNQIGVDRTNTALGTMPGTSSGTFLTATFNASGVALVQRWLDTPATNQGVILIGPTSYTNDTRYRTRNWGNVGQRPILTVDYVTVPTKTLVVAPGPAVNWSTAAWSPPGAPAGGELVQIQGGGTVVFDDASNPSLLRVVVEGGSELQVPAQTLTVTELLVVDDGTLTVSGGRVVNAGGVKVLPGANVSLDAGSLELGAGRLWVGGTLRTRGGTLQASGAGTIDVQVRGTLDVDGLTFQDGDVEGLHVFEQATITRLRGATFADLDVALGAGARHLTIEATSLDLNAPGNVFGAVNAGQFNVRLEDTDTVTAADVVVNLEDRGTNGAGAGSGFEDQAGGFINWVHAAPDTTSGSALGFPKVAYDRSTFSNPYAIYATFADVGGPNTADRIHVFDPSGTADGVDQGYYFEVASGDGDIVGFPWNDQDGGGNNVLWALTTTGNIIRWTDPGSGSGAIAPDYVTPIASSFTTPPLTHEGSYVYGAGLNGSSQPRFYMMNYDGSLFTALATADGLNEPISTELSSEIQGGTTMIFAGTGSSGFTSVQTLVNEDFESGTGAFTYVPNTFRSTTNPAGNLGLLTPDSIPPDAFPQGGSPGNGVKVYLGTNTSLMSGGWSHTFNVSGAPVEVQIDFEYRLWSTDRFEPDEYCEALFSLDGTLYGTGPNDYLARQVGDGNGGPDMDTGWVPYSLTLPLGDGPHTIVLGGFLNKSTEGIEYAQAVFDNVTVVARYSDGRIYRINTSIPAVDADSNAPNAPVQAAPYPAFGGGLFVGDLSGTVHGIDQTTMAPLAGWPVQPNLTPMRCNVWQDFFNGRLFWGNEAGQLFGYDMSGNPLPGYPSTPFGASPIRGGGTVLGGVLYVTSDTGRIVAIDASSGTPTTFPDDYRFGDTTALTRIAFDWTGRMMIATSKGKWIVIDRVADPTPGSP